MSNKRRFRMVFPVIMVLFSGSVPIQAAAVWQDSFDDASSLDNYEIVNGELSSDGVLTSLGCENSCDYGPTYFYRNSLGAIGTWSFDFNLTSNLNFFFIGIGKVSGHALFPKQGYNFVIRPSLKSFTLDFVTSPITNLASYKSEKTLIGWMHIDITRDEVGEIVIYLDGKPIIETTQKDLTSSEHINIQLTKGSQLDNLVYSNSVDIPTDESDGDDSPISQYFVFLGVFSSILLSRKIRTK